MSSDVFPAQLSRPDSNFTELIDDIDADSLDGDWEGEWEDVDVEGSSCTTKEPQRKRVAAPPSLGCTWGKERRR